ncbi:hypothetical protein [Azospirillum sp.]|uniref:hypothetical protein n=1 Tax=Azospirillum sp. TaxID=34012 RepID=UPI003D72C496
MSVWNVAGAMALAYLLLLARSAWKQGELRQFLWSLAILAGVVAVIAAVVAAAVWMGR